MRKTPYVISLVVLLVTLTLSLTSLIRPQWISTREDSPSYLVRHLDYGLWRSCEWETVNPYRPPSLTSFVTPLAIDRNETCRPFPPRSECDQSGQQSLCVVWSTAGYLGLLSLFPLLVSALVLVVISVGLGERTVRRDRRKAGWKAVGALVAASAVLQGVALSMIGHLYRTDATRFKNIGHLGSSFHLLIGSAILSLVLFGSLTYTGLAAERGKVWAGGRSAGKRRGRLARSASGRAAADESAPLLSE